MTTAQVDVITPGRLVRVTPEYPQLTNDDILEFAAALIEEEGWKETVADQGAGNGEQAPWTIHQAVGEASRRATASGQKDSSAARPFRDGAARQIAKAHNGQTEQQLNDAATDAEAAVAIIRESIGA